MTQTPDVTGDNLIAGRSSRDQPERFRAVDPRTARPLEPAFAEASSAEIAAAAQEAAAAFGEYRRWTGERVARLLRAIAQRLEDAPGLIDVADAETALGGERLSGERARACGQLRTFAQVAEDGWHLEAIIDHADEAAAPPRPDLRRMLIPIGPVAVFGASNFPLAFSVPGGDTASALAAGCPVVAKGHPSHPGTSELCARAIQAAAADEGAPPGVFSLLQGQGAEVGQALVRAPEIKAVGFTGSHRAGRALFDAGAQRPEPIPVYAEMGSVNPVFVTRRALLARGPQIARGFVASMTMGTGQFCTKPGIVFVPDDDAGAGFVAEVAAALRAVAPTPMLNEGICRAFASQLAQTSAVPGVEAVVAGGAAEEGFALAPSLLSVDADTFGEVAELRTEHFGPAALVVRVAHERFEAAAEALEPGLTATIHAEALEAERIAPLRDLLAQKAGRLVWNGFPTGAAVAAAQHHGGPYPATTAAAHTSVGATAVRRFMRPVAYQGYPAQLLPPALRDDNPLGIHRLVDGRWTDGAST